MALEDLAMFRAIPTCTVFYPSDAVSTERAVELSANTKVWRLCQDPSDCLHSDAGEITSPSLLCCRSQGICFIRTSRPDTAVIYSPDEKFEVGVAKVIIKLASVTSKYVLFQNKKKTRAWVFVFDQVVRQSDNDVVTVIGAGVTLHEALAAADVLASEGALMSPSSGEVYTFQGLTNYIS